MTLDDLNAATAADFAAAMAPVFEGAHWVAERAAEVRPFPTVTALHQALFDAVLEAPVAAQVAFLRAHPDLAGQATRQRSMGAHSTAEQASLGLDRLDEAGFARFAAMNEAYVARFGFPFMICVRRHTRGSILRQFARRLAASLEAELAAALGEVFRITRLRMGGVVDGPGMPEIAGVLSTHVLDTATGMPGAGIKVELFVLEDTGPELLRSVLTNGDGRVSGGLLADGGPLRIGTYEMRFHVGPYFASTGTVVTDPPFLDVVPIRVGIAEPESHYHVPLLVTPWTYATYRGS